VDNEVKKLAHLGLKLMLGHHKTPFVVLAM